MNEYIMDGKPHILNEKLGYILKKVNIYLYCNKKEEIEDLLLQYATYLYENDKENTIDYVMHVFMDLLKKDLSPPNTNFILRPPSDVSYLAQYGTFALKFQRCKQDNLKD